MNLFKIQVPIEFRLMIFWFLFYLEQGFEFQCFFHWPAISIYQFHQAMFWFIFHVVLSNWWYLEHDNHYTLLECFQLLIYWSIQASTFLLLNHRFQYQESSLLLRVSFLNFYFIKVEIQTIHSWWRLDFWVCWFHLQEERFVGCNFFSKFRFQKTFN